MAKITLKQLVNSRNAQNLVGQLSKLDRSQVITTKSRDGSEIVVRATPAASAAPATSKK